MLYAFQLKSKILRGVRPSIHNFWRGDRPLLFLLRRPCTCVAYKRKGCVLIVFVLTTCFELQLTRMKFALTLVIVAVLPPCMLAFNHDRPSEEDVALLRKWLEDQKVKGQSCND